MTVLGQIILLFMLMQGSISEFSYELCKSRGFEKSKLVCSTCKHFLEPKFECKEAYNDCIECCLDDEEVIEKFPKAALEVCTCKYGAYPQIEAFIKSDRPKKYKKRLEIKHVRGLDPIIKLYDSDDEVKREFDIHKWTTDQVEDFFDTHLIMD
ncbi:hypothetical protein QAD02_008593 [Eretmocerus hayati]|uniref:Uncharacterized protein n=1 Tax=Eretmocerus hayati TaxID=131215 RepID=A0ACC2N7R0_9HYME|nr:hypothetical protein QAD02_008593 [Eretmocerus hayati]